MIPTPRECQAAFDKVGDLLAYEMLGAGGLSGATAEELARFVEMANAFGGAK